MRRGLEEAAGGVWLIVGVDGAEEEGQVVSIVVEPVGDHWRVKGLISLIPEDRCVICYEYSAICQPVVHKNLVLASWIDQPPSVAFNVQH